MKYLILLLTTIILISCLNDVECDKHEYHEIEVDVNAFCTDKENGNYYFGPTKYNHAQVLYLYDGYWLEMNCPFVDGKGFRFACWEGGSQYEDLIIKWQ